MLTPEAALDAFRAAGSFAAAGRALGCHAMTVKRYAQMADATVAGRPGGRFKGETQADPPPRLGSSPLRAPAEPAPWLAGRPSTMGWPELAPGRVRPPPLPDPDVPIEHVLDQAADRFSRLATRRAAEQWAPIAIPHAGPIGVVWFGDPHLGDDGCNLPLLRRHIELCRSVPGLYGANIGDVTNNWVGRLARLYADQSSSRSTERRLARWFMRDAGIGWLFWLLGNHDEWEQGPAIYELMAEKHLMIADWEAKVRLVWGDGSEVKVHAAHDFPGHSMWNIGHGPTRAAKMTSDADLYVCGHKHDWTVQQFERPDGSVPTIVRARGYKWLDHYVTRNGFQQSQSGASVMTVLNPLAADPSGRVLAFADVETGVMVLAALRAGAGATAGPQSGPGSLRREPPAKPTKPQEPAPHARRPAAAPRSGGKRSAAAKPAPAKPVPASGGGSRGRDRLGQEHRGTGAGKAPRVPGVPVRDAAEADARGTRRAAPQPVRQPAGKKRAARNPRR